MKVWLVSQGYYSDYSIEGVFSSENLANEFAALYSEASGAEVEEFVVDDLAIRPGMLYFWIEIDRDGNTYHNAQGSPPTSRFVDDIYPLHKSMQMGIWARDIEHAIKIANEKRVQLIADNEWTLDPGEWKKIMTTER